MLHVLFNTASVRTDCCRIQRNMSHTYKILFLSALWKLILNLTIARALSSFNFLHTFTNDGIFHLKVRHSFCHSVHEFCTTLSYYTPVPECTWSGIMYWNCVIHGDRDRHAHHNIKWAPSFGNIIMLAYANFRMLSEYWMKNMEKKQDLW